MTSYKDTLEYLYRQLPMFHRVGAAAYKANLDNTIAICAHLGNPEKNFRSVHVAGTNGKGSVSHMLAAVLQSAGYKTGLYTSPHLKDFRERIRIDGKMIPRAAVTQFVGKHKEAFEKIQPSFFEWTVGLAFDHFSKAGVEVAVIETGLGGRLDSTNVITPLLSIITNISYDHQHLLGETLRQIAGEKAGIIKPGVPVLIAETQQEVEEIFRRKAAECNAPVSFADQSVIISDPKIHEGLLNVQMAPAARPDQKTSLLCELNGFYQTKNIAAVIEAAVLLDTNCGLPVPDEAILQGLRHVCTLTGLKGRWQTLSEKPLTIADTGHNEAGIHEVLRMIEATPHKKLHFVLGMVADKDVRSVLKLLPKDAMYYFCKANLPRALDAHELAAAARVFQLKGEVYSSVRSALKGAQQAAEAKDLVFVGGSTFTVAEVV